MKVDKKKFPLDILQQLNVLKTNYPPDVCKIVKSDDALIRYEDIDESSEFYFQINSFTEKNREFYYNITRKPADRNTLEKTNQSLNYSSLREHLKIWENIIREFNDTPHFDEDPIINSYTEEFFEYRIIEDDADTASFDIKRQLLIDKYLDDSIKYLEQCQKENLGTDMSEPIEAAVDLKQTLTKLTKNQVLRKLAKFWAIARKKGLSFFKQVFFELAKEVIKEFFKKQIGM